MIRKILAILILAAIMAIPASADYTLQFQALTNSPADGATVYIGIQPSAPTASASGVQVVPVAGTINVTEAYDFSGTAGTNQEVAYYLRVNNATDYLIAKVSSATSERVFTNSSMGVVVAAGDTIVIKRIQPTWATNPLTNIVGGYALIDTPDEVDRGYALYGMALSNSPADSVENYIGGKPAVPSTTEGQDKIFIPTKGSFTQGLVSDYSGTAGTAEAYSYSLDVNGTDYLIESRSVSQQLRLFNNTSMNIPVDVGNYLEFQRQHPAWATNPLTNVVGATAWVNLTDIHNINDGYPIHTFALSHTPADNGVVYYGYRPIAPSTTTGTNKMYIRQAGVIKKAGVYSYSGTAGSGEAWSQYIVVNNADAYLIATVSSATNERMWINTTMNITVNPGDYVEMRSNQPAFATNPATTVYGGGFYLEYEDELPTASFTSTTPYGDPPHNVTFTDTSSALSPLEYSWWWTNVENSTTVMFNASQNPDEKFDLGHFYISHGISNASGYANTSGTYLISVTESGGYTGLTTQDVFLEARKTLTLKFKSSTTGETIPVVGVYDMATGNMTNISTGTFVGTYSWGTQAFIFYADGYVSRTGSYFVDDDVEYTVQMVPSTASSAPVYNVYPPKDVKFHITSFFGAPIPGASVTIQGITTSTGNWDWLVTLLGISLDEVAINGTAMTETTDSNGDAVFLMLPSVKYNITTTATGYTFPSTIIAPQATEYTITANWNESWFKSGNDTLKDVNVSVSWVTINSTHSFVNITYDDQTTTTTGGDFRVYRESPNRVYNVTPIAVLNITGSSCSNSTTVDTPTGGASYRVDVNATTTSGNNIVRTFTHYFKGSPVTLPGWTSETLLWLALFIVIFTAAFAGAIHSPQMAIVLCVESWVFWAIGWLDALITQFWYGETAIIGVLVLASFLAVVWNIAEGKSKVKRSS